ncbi:MAG: dipeptidase [Gemmatimonadota bacterium]
MHIRTPPLLALAVVTGVLVAFAPGRAQSEAGSAGPSAVRPPDPATLERALRLLDEVPLVDGHNDLPWQIREKAAGDLDSLDIAQPQPGLHTDVERLRRGRVGAQFFAAYVPSDLIADGATRFALMQIDLIHRLADRYADTFVYATTAADIERAHDEGRIAALIGVEGGHAIEGSLDVLRGLYDLGTRYMTLTHWQSTAWADAATDRALHQGLTPFGEDVVREMNRLGMLVDLSHVSDSTMMDALRITAAPVIYSHSSARALAGHVRNVPDGILPAVADNGGVVMVNFSPGFINEEARLHGDRADAVLDSLRTAFSGDSARTREAFEGWLEENPAPRATLYEVADHIDHIVEVAGIDHVGLGSDYDGIDHVPVGLEDVSRFPVLIAELLERGYSDDDIRKLVGLNFLRVMREAESASERLREEHDPYVGTISPEVPREEEVPAP